MVLVAGVDSSTQSCTVVVREAGTGAFVRSGSAPHPSGTEVDPEHWWTALLAAISEAGGLADVAALSVGGQQHGMVCLDGGGRVIRPALLWHDLGVPVDVPPDSAYVADGAARQAAWVLAGGEQPPVWGIDEGRTFTAEHTPEILDRYRATARVLLAG